MLYYGDKVRISVDYKDGFLKKAIVGTIVDKSATNDGDYLVSVACFTRCPTEFWVSDKYLTKVR
jgi:hypothetical protein